MELTFEEKLTELRKVMDSRKEAWEKKISSKKRKWEERLKQKAEEKDSLSQEALRRERFWQEKFEKLQEEERILKESLAREIQNLKGAYDAEQSKWNDTLLAKDRDMAQAKSDLAALDENIKEKSREKSIELEKVSAELQNQIKGLSSSWEFEALKTRKEEALPASPQVSLPAARPAPEYETAAETVKEPERTPEKPVPAPGPAAFAEVSPAGQTGLKNSGLSEEERLRRDFEKWKSEKLGVKSAAPSAPHSSMLDRWISDRKK